MCFLVTCSSGYIASLCTESGRRRWRDDVPGNPCRSTGEKRIVLTFLDAPCLPSLPARSCCAAGGQRFEKVGIRSEPPPTLFTCLVDTSGALPRTPEAAMSDRVIQEDPRERVWRLLLAAIGIKFVWVGRQYLRLFQ